jgi:hypothetical protein
MNPDRAFELAMQDAEEEDIESLEAAAEFMNAFENGGWEEHYKRDQQALDELRKKWDKPESLAFIRKSIEETPWGTRYD